MKKLQYQTNAIAALRDFFRRASELRYANNGIKRAFEEVAHIAASKAALDSLLPQAAQRGYFDDLKNLKGEVIPQVCLRLPTGAGKTFLAAQAIGVAAREWLGGAYPLAIWLVPSDIILQQTLKALQTNGHPYQKALADAFGTDLEVINLAALGTVSAQEWGKKAVVLVTTGQALKIDAAKKEMRNVYAHDESFESQFVNYSQARADELGLERVTLEDVTKAQLNKSGEVRPGYQGISPADVGKVKWSAINLIRAQKPMVIVDEAHRGYTDLGKEVLERVNACCVVEMTATPKTDDAGHTVMNVLFHVSAQALKAEQMIKMPVMLRERTSDWTAAVDEAVLKRNELEEIAKGDVDYIRPIMLLQAESKNDKNPDTVTPDKLMDYLTKTHRIPEGQIAIATGEQKDLDGVDLMSDKCQVRYVITVQALVEGWDCPFAYVLCSVRNMRSNTAIVQLLGRILRMPYAQERKNAALNCAYAFAVTDRLGMAAGELVSLITDKENGLGLDQLEASELVRAVEQPMLAGFQPNDLFTPTATATAPLFSVEITKKFDVASLPLEEQARVTIEKDTASGKTYLNIVGAVSPDARELIVSAVKKDSQDGIRQKIAHQNYTVQRLAAPSANGVRFMPLPKLYLKTAQGELLLLQAETLAALAGWSLTDEGDVELPNFQLDNGRVVVLDMDKGKLMQHFVPTEQIELLGHAELTLDDLIYYLDEQLQQNDVTPAQMGVYLAKVLAQLQTPAQGFTLATLASHRMMLKNALAEKIKHLRNAAVAKQGAQLLLGADSDAVVAHDVDKFEFKPERYAPRTFYEGRFKFAKHYYPIVGDLKDWGEEFECAQVIDAHPAIRHWVRNIERSEFSFALPTEKGGNAYPDFVCDLLDGRSLVVEYKGGNIDTADDAKNKNTIGKLWARKSGNVYVMPIKKHVKGSSVGQQIDAAIAGG